MKVGFNYAAALGSLLGELTVWAVVCVAFAWAVDGASVGMVYAFICLWRGFMLPFQDAIRAGRGKP